jgi:adenosine deaminase CECR1
MIRFFAFALALLLIYGCKTAKEASSSYKESFVNADAYYNYRYEMMKRVKRSRFDAKTEPLDSLELKANDVFLELVEAEKKRLNDVFPPSKYFCEVRKKIEVSPFFDLMKVLPKGAMTRGHMQTIGDYSWLLEKAFNDESAYIFIGGDNSSWVNHSLHFFDHPPNDKWRSIKTLNNVYEGDFINEVHELVTLGKDDHPYDNIDIEYKQINHRIKGLLTYRPLFRDYVKKIFEDFIAENVTYVELHSSFNGMYDLKRSYFNPSQEMDLYVSIRNEIKKSHPEFDFKVIYSLEQSEKEKTLKEHYEIALNLFENFPDVFGGFDFAKKKYDKAEIKSLVNLYFKTRQDPYYAEIFLPLFFNPEESIGDFHEGIYDAILLNSIRVGYALEMYKHPELMKLLRDKEIAIEISPIANQVFKFVPDLRQHPVEVYINHGVPFVLGSDKQGILKHGLSHQYYEAVMAWNLDLKSLKHLILNSINYSLKDESEKAVLKKLWENKWRVFMQDVLNNSKKYKY